MRQKHINRSAIALLITVFFVMLITLSLGIGLKYVKNSYSTMNNESFMTQSTVVLDDFLKILKTSPDLKQVKDSDSLAVFLAQSALLPFENSGVKVLIQITSARAKINPNTFNSPERLDVLRSFLIKNMINVEYSNMLSDLIGGIKEDNLYNTDIFNEYPYLFRDYISSDKHLEKLGEIYKKKYHDNALEKIEMKKLFYANRDQNSSIDLNYATPLAWELMIGCDKDRANELSLGGFGAYTPENPPSLSNDENESLSQFSYNYYEPIIDVKIEINKNDENAEIRFEYEINSTKVSNFVFKV